MKISIHQSSLDTLSQAFRNMEETQRKSVTECAKYYARLTWTTTLLVKHKFACYFHSAHLHSLASTADSKDAFRRYNGVEVLIEMLRAHKDAQVARALVHVLRDNGKKR